MSMTIDFAGLAARLLADSRALLESWLPAGKWSGHEYLVGSINGEPGKSLSINANTGKWADFAADIQGGDLVSLFAAINGLRQADAARQLDSTIPAKKGNGSAGKPAALVVVPTSEPPASMVHPTHGRPSASWQYRNAEGLIIAAVARYDPPGGKKQFCPYLPTDHGWVARMHPDPRPLYGLDLIATRPKTGPRSAILIVEGEKSADAARGMGSPYIVVTWMGGAGTWRKTDWTPIHGRQVLCWPDNDPAGASMADLARELARHCPEVKIIDVAGMPDGWDAADSGFDWPAFKSWAVPRISVLQVPTIDIAEPPKATEGYNKPLRSELWPEPLDIFRSPVLPTLRPEWLPDVISRFSMDQAPIIGTDFAVVAMSCLAACAGAIHDMIKVQPHTHNPNWLESTRLWIAIVGKPSVKKTPAFKRATSHLKKIDIELGKVEEAALAKFKLEQKIYEAAEKKYISKHSGNSPVGQPVPPEPPSVDRLLIGDVTVAALSEILKRSTRGVLRIADELAGWFGGMDAFNSSKGGKDRSDWLEAYNGGSQRIDRIMRGTIIVPNWSVSILGGIQPEAIQRIVGQADDDGLLQRFMMVVSYSAEPGVNRIPDKCALEAYRETIDRLFYCQPDSEPIKLSPEAAEIHQKIVEFQYEIIRLGVLPSAMETCLGKYEGLSARLMLTFHMIECAAAKESYMREISEATADRVYYFMTEFLFHHAYEFYTETLSESGLTDHVRRIGSMILAKSLGSLTNRELTHDYRWWRNAKEWEKTQVIQRLTDSGWIKRKPNPIENFKTVPSAFMVNPELHSKFAQKAASEQAKRAKLIEALQRRK